MTRKSIPTNVVRQLWSKCGGYCQNPQCRSYLFSSVDEDLVSLANMAHIIGHGEDGPRSEHELAEAIDKDGLSNLIMLCLMCHKIVDELEKKYSVEEMQEWKSNHAKLIQNLFDTPFIKDEREILIQLNELIEENGAIFREYGPYSKNVLEGQSGDAGIVWKRRCLDTILPNNRKIINLVEKNKRNFAYPWDVYRSMLGYKLHVDAFEDNCLLGLKVNDYKLFPIEFEHFIKTKLGVEVPRLEHVQKEEIEFRYNQASTIIERFLRNHNFIRKIEKRNEATIVIDLKDERSLKIFITYTYFFTEYTLNKVLAIDPNIDVIMCASPMCTYFDHAKRLCIEKGIGLFRLNEFLGALPKKDDDYLNFLLKQECESRINNFCELLKKTTFPSKLKFYLFGSYLRRKIFNDIDILIVYSDELLEEAVKTAEVALKEMFESKFTFYIGQEKKMLDVSVCSLSEFKNLDLEYNNLRLVFET